MTPRGTPKNQLYYGDNLPVLRDHVAADSVDLIYLDPPFNSNASYNVLFKQHGTDAASQIQAFEDTWRWDESAARAYSETVETGGPISEALQAFRHLVGESDMLAYLAMMAPRLAELRRVLKPTGSLYLHCDPTASHYLKLLLDAVFGAERFGTEIVWKRTGAHSDTKQGRKLHGHIHDVILFYSRSQNWTWNPIYTDYDRDYVANFYRHVEEGTGRRFQMDNLTAARPGGDTKYEWRVKRRGGAENWEADLENEFKKPKKGWDYLGVGPYKGRIWAYSKSNMVRFAKEGRLYYTANGMPRYKRYLDEMPGVPLQDLWTDIPPIGAGAAERLGYPTQKPVALLERIIRSSSNEGDVVLDPFCGCGTTIDAAQKLGRRWIGIDITYLAINLIRRRLNDTFGSEIVQSFEVVGEPTSVPDARVLAGSNPYQFQWWALDLVGARPADEKKGADKGIDGRIYFHDDPATGKTKQVILSVKAGKLKPTFVRELQAVVERESASIGVLISMHPPTRAMRSEAAASGSYVSPWGKHPKIQLLTVTELLEGKRVDMPAATGSNVTFKRAKKHLGGSSSEGQMSIREEPAPYNAGNLIDDRDDEELT